MRICLVAPAPVAASRVSHSVRDLAALLAGQHEVTLIHSGLDAAPPGPGEAQGFREVHAVPDEALERFGFSCQDHRHSAAVMEEIRAAYEGGEGPDYLEVCDFRAHGLVALQARRAGDPLLSETLIGVRISPSLELQSLHDGTMGLPWTERVAELEREQMRLADRLIWPGGSALDLYARHYHDLELPPPAKIHPAAPAGALAAPRPPAEPGGPLRLLYLGDLRQAGGVLDLAEACRWLPAEEWRLTIAGPDTETAAMAQSVRLTIEAILGDDPRLRLDTQAGAEQLPRLLAEHDVLVVPARLGAWSEQALAAMRAGLPVLATPVGALPEVLAGGAGWLAGGAGSGELGRSLARLLADPAEVERAGRAAAERAAELDDPDPVLRAYEEMIGSAAPTPLPSPPSEEPRVTGIVPFYGAAAHVSEAVASLLAQTHSNLDVLVVNDGSFREEDGVLAELAEDPRVRVVTKPNGGENAARNLGTVLAGGQYLVMLDADNLLEPEFVERALLAYRRNPDLSYVTCWLRAIDADGSDSRLAGGYAPLGNAVLGDLRENWDGDALAMLPARLFNVAGVRYDEAGAMHSDWQLYRRLRREGRHGIAIPERLARYRLLPDSLSRAYSDEAMARGWEESRDRIRLEPDAKGVPMSEIEDRTAEVAERQRVEELERLNAALAAEVRDLTLGRAEAPGSAPTPTSRRLAKILDERDTAAEGLARVQAELARTTAHRDEIERRNAELGAEVARLRGGIGGFLRRLRAKLLPGQAD